MTPARELFSIDPTACNKCYRCTRCCPVHAIRICEAGATEIMQDRCVGCGLCFEECPHRAVVVRDDGAEVDALLAGGRPVVALLAPEYTVALHPLNPVEVEAALLAAGFHAVESTLLGEEAVALAYEEHLSEAALPVIRSTCPVVNDYVRKYHPDLVGLLAPVDPPHVAQARLIKLAYPEGVAVVYASPCYARRDEVLAPQMGGVIDGAIDFRGLQRALDAIGPHGSSAAELAPRIEPVKEISLNDGFPRSTLTSRDMTATDVLVVRGLHDLEGILCALEAGEAAPSVIDALNCEGCIDGPAVNPHLSLFAKRHIEAAGRRDRFRSRVSTRDVLSHLPPIELRRAFDADPVRIERPDEASLQAVLVQVGLGGSDALDCGACAFDTCREFAAAIYRCETDWAACPPVRERQMAAEMAEIEESAALDPLTGLANRTIFDLRMREEFARQSRYGGEVSLLMIDIDQFKGINDKYGHLAGDEVLKTVASTIRSSLRVSDIPVRYGGDEFAVVLPQTGKTEAFAVAEKLRMTVEQMGISVMRGDEDPVIAVRVSVGVASTSDRWSGSLELIEAADRALYQAKAHGRNQVRLAPG